jgi:hypothetical protein
MLIVSPSLGLDRVVELPELRPGEVLRFTKATVTAGRRLRPAVPGTRQRMGAADVLPPGSHRAGGVSLLVPQTKHICTGALPKCSTCPVLEFCQQVGVTRHR